VRSRLEASHLVKEYSIRSDVGRRRSHFRAVDDVSFVVEQGETVALVGESGCGKSTTARMALGLIEPTSGAVTFNGQNMAGIGGESGKAIRRQVQMIFQDPSGGVNPRKTVFRILRDPLLFHGLASKENVRDVATNLLERVGLTPAAVFLDRYPHQISGGQRQRIVIARAISLQPSIVVADEPVSALDVSIRAQVLELLKELQRDLGIGYLLITHDLAVVRSVAHRVAVMYLGRIVETGPVEQIFASPQHPYTRGLLAATPSPNPVLARARRQDLVLGEVLTARNHAGGCSFQPRCPVAVEPCLKEDPVLITVGVGRTAACHLANGDTAHAPADPVPERLPLG
jgi:oligopeptide transport system ATP-binding protein